MRKNKLSKNITGYSYLLPALLLFVLIELFPIIYNIYISFYKWSGFGTPELIGFNNYINIFTNDIFIKVLLNSGIFVLVALGVMLPFSFIVALFLDSGIPGAGIFRGLFFIPTITPIVVTALVWKRVYSPQGGLLNQFLEIIRLSFLQNDWLGNPDTALTAILVVWVWRFFGYGVIMFYAGLIGIPDDIKNAAKLDGASSFKVVIYIIMPLMKSIIFIVAILHTIWALKVFTLIFVMTQGGPNHATEVLNLYMYNTVFRYHKLGEGSAVTTIILVILLFISILRNRFKAAVEY